jgi:hypothetical protein
VQDRADLGQVHATAQGGMHLGVAVPGPLRTRPLGSRRPARRSFGLGGLVAQAGLVAGGGSFDSLGEVVEQMPPVRDLDSKRGTAGGAFGIAAAAVPANHLDTFPPSGKITTPAGLAFMKNNGRSGARSDDHTRARAVAAEEPPDLQLNGDLLAPRSGISQPPPVTAVHPHRPHTTGRAAHPALLALAWIRTDLPARKTRSTARPAS